MTSRLRDVLPALDRPYLMGEFRPRLGSTRSGRAKLIELDDADAFSLAAGEWLVAQFAYGLAPVEVIRAKKSAAGESGHEYEVPVIEARIPTGKVLAYAPEELCRVRESKAPQGGRLS